MKNTIYKHINSIGKKLAVLIDPDKQNEKYLDELLHLANSGKIDFFFVGGSLVFKHPESSILYLKRHTSVPVILFPGSILQYTPKADAVLFLSLISGRNPDYLIGNHITIAPLIKQDNIEVLPTGYILISTGKTTSVEFISNTTPIPDNKTDIAIATAIAGEMLGLKLLYMDAGSGAEKPVSEQMINEVKKNINIPLIIGGGLKNKNHIIAACKAGADIIVLGTTVEKGLNKLSDIADTIHSF